MQKVKYILATSWERLDNFNEKKCIFLIKKLEEQGIKLYDNFLKNKKTSILSMENKSSAEKIKHYFDLVGIDTCIIAEKYDDINRLSECKECIDGKYKDGKSYNISKIDIYTLIIFFLFLYYIIRKPILFGIITFIISLFSLSKIEYDKAVHDRSFYSINKPSKSIVLFLSLWSNGSVFAMSFVFSIMVTILFSGTEIQRIETISNVFVFLVLIGIIVSSMMEKISSFNIERWGYVKMSALLGIIFSIIISKIESIGLYEVAKIYIGRNISNDLNKVCEIIYALSYEINNFISKALCGFFGDIAGELISFMLTTNVIYGFIIYIYVIQYIKLKNKYEAWIKNNAKIKSNLRATKISYS